MHLGWVCVVYFGIDDLLSLYISCCGVVSAAVTFHLHRHSQHIHFESLNDFTLSSFYNRHDFSFYTQWFSLFIVCMKNDLSQCNDDSCLISATMD